jgi:hypothetical protein
MTPSQPRRRTNTPNRADEPSHDGPIAHKATHAVLCRCGHHADWHVWDNTACGDCGCSEYRETAP